MASRLLIDASWYVRISSSGMTSRFWAYLHVCKTLRYIEQANTYESDRDGPLKARERYQKEKQPKAAFSVFVLDGGRRRLELLKQSLSRGERMRGGRRRRTQPGGARTAMEDGGGRAEEGEGARGRGERVGDRRADPESICEEDSASPHDARVNML